MSILLVYRRFLLILVVLGLSACSDESDFENQISDTIGGTVTAPNGKIAHSFSQDSILLAFLDMLVPQADATVIGLTPVTNALVELVEINNSGEQVGGALAQATTDGSGFYVMETGAHGIPPSGNLVLQVTGSGGAKMRSIYARGGSNVNPISDYIVDTVINQPGVNLETLNVEYIRSLGFTASSSSNIDFSTALTINEAKNLIAADNTTNTTITDGVVNLISAASLGLPIDVSQTTATSTISYSGYNACYNVLGGWEYSFSGTAMTLVGTDTWTDNCGLAPAETIVVTMTSLAPDYDIPFNCAAYPICNADDFNKKLQGVDDDGRSYTSFYHYNGNTMTLTYTKYLPEQVFTEVITIN